ncbi:DUF4358 domain-containing protein [Clostridium culturomicium]|uniref:DUF4358 domain-containing protein n=1 Tax=Clostridium culturomicium TaxID=1499683 RepID=UPI00058AFB57|nr:DUF4358 domain-containing protein [Clostridium culturomicium]
MKSYKREYFILVVVVLITFIGLYNVLKIKEPDMEKLKTKILDSADLNNMVEGDAQRLRKLYYINKNQVEDFIFFAPKTNMDASEILILKAKSKEDLTELKEKVETRLEKSASSFESYRPEQYELLKHKVLKVRGNYLILIVSKSASEIEELIEEEF